MEAKLQKAGSGVGTIIAMTHVRDECMGQLLGSMPGSMHPRRQQPAETLSDLEYANAMEERYGIGEEGIF